MYTLVLYKMWDDAAQACSRSRGKAVEWLDGDGLMSKRPKSQMSRHQSPSHSSVHHSRRAEACANMFAAATSFFARTAISQSYNIGASAGASPGNGSRSSTPGPGGSTAPTPASTIPPATAQVPVGLWKVQAASHKTTGKRVSVWTFDKRGPDVERLGPMAKERTLEVLKAEVGASLVGCSTKSQILTERNRHLHWVD